MHSNQESDLEGQIREKQEQLAQKEKMLAQYAQNIGRDRWYNRGRHDVTTLRQELAQLEAQRLTG